MIPKYIPVLKALSSEFGALAEIDKADARKTRPLFEVARIGANILEAKRFEGCEARTTAYLDETIAGISKVWNGRSAMIDAYQWPPDATIESGEHVLSYIHSRLNALGVRAIPVIGYDRWSNEAYRLAIQSLEVPNGRDHCLRLDTHAIEDAAEPDFFKENIQTLLDDLGLAPSEC
jgi:hypothetical protein